MKRIVIAAALLSIVSAAAMATTTTSTSSSTSGGSTSASVSGFGRFTATDYGVSNGNAQALAGGARLDGQSHERDDEPQQYVDGRRLRPRHVASGRHVGADAAANAWSKLGGGWR